jgi:hypothetical protein
LTVECDALIQTRDCPYQWNCFDPGCTAN